MLKSLRKWQIGLEDTPGVEVDASDRLLGDITVTDASETVTPEADYGLQDEVVEAPVLALEGTDLSWETDLSYEQCLYAFLAGIIGGVTPGAEQTPGQGDYEWVFTPVAAAKPDVDTFTIEYIETDGTLSEEWTALQAICSELGISWEAGPNLAQMSSTWFANGMTNKAATAGVAKPARTLIPAKKVTVKLATSFAGLDAAGALTGVLSGEWTLATGLMRKDRSDGDLGYADYKAQKRRAELTLTVDLDGTFEDERVNKFRGGDNTFIRIEVTGAQIGSGLFKTITVDGCYVLPEWNDFGNDDDNESTIELGYVSQYDPVGGYAFRVTVINDVDILPGAEGS